MRRQRNSHSILFPTNKTAPSSVALQTCNTWSGLRSKKGLLAVGKLSLNVLPQGQKHVLLRMDEQSYEEEQDPVPLVLVLTAWFGPVAWDRRVEDEGRASWALGWYGIIHKFISLGAMQPRYET